MPDSTKVVGQSGCKGMIVRR